MLKRAVITVTNDLVTDQRAHKIALTLIEMGYDVTLVGRKLKNSPEINRNYSTKCFSLLFNKGFLFYACYNVRLFFYLIFNQFNLVWSCDLDTLSACYFSSKLKKSKLIYDSHELFTEVPELSDRPFVKNVWLKIEKFIFPKLKTVFTVSQSIADIYSEKYKMKVQLLRNFPFRNNISPYKNASNNVILYQGAINKDRGIEELVLAMRKINGYKLLIIGAGDVFDEVQKLIHLNNLQDRVELLGRVFFDELDVFTSQAVLAVSLEKRTSKSYEYALPNKIFDYIKNEVPILVSNLPEMRGVIEKYLVGELIDEISPESIAERINTILLDSDKLQEYSLNCRKAHEELNWENESQIIVKSLSE